MQKTLAVCTPPHRRLFRRAGRFRRALIIAAILAVFPIKCFPLDYGAIFYTDTSFRFDGGDYKKCILEQTESLAPYIKASFNDGSRLCAEALIRHKLVDVFGIDYKGQNKAIIDIPLLKYEKAFKFDGGQNLRLAAGRIYMIDATGNILSQTSDGALLKYAGTKVQAGLYCGYTGLQNIKTTETICSSGEKYALSNEKPVYDCAAPYVLVAGSAVLPYLFAEQTLSFEAIACIKSAGPNKLPAEEKNRFYATAMLSGQILPTLFHSESITAEITDAADASIFAKFILTYFAPFRNTKISFNAVYASGKNGALSAFTPITRQYASLSALEPTYSGIMKFGVAASIIPFGKFRVSAAADFVFNVAEGAEYSGFQAEARADWNIFSDLNVALGINTFVGKDAKTSRTEIKLGAALAF